MVGSPWLLFLPQVPSAPSSLRVLVWRRLRTAGAISLQHGVWILPQTPEHVTFTRELLAEVRTAGGDGLVLSVSVVAGTDDASIIERFRMEREKEYAEFNERCRELLREIERESAQGKFTFAELEENEEDYAKLSGWLQKIQARDFFPGHEADQATTNLAGCRAALDAFTQIVFSRESDRVE